MVYPYIFHIGLNKTSKKRLLGASDLGANRHRIDEGVIVTTGPDDLGRLGE
jgi:hypothetical protein